MGRVKGSKNKSKMAVIRTPVPESADPLVRHIPLTKGQFAIVDAADYDWLNQWNWTAMWMPRQKKYYAVRGTTNENGKKRLALMHQVILNAPEGVTVDHRDRSGLNNRRNNLRLATYSQQNCNRFDSRGSSRFKGVSRTFGKTKPWRVRVKLNGITKWVGYADTEEEGAEMYRKAALELHGEFSLAGERG
jgi:hypothetical protein